jgi:hypothetical protein
MKLLERLSGIIFKLDTLPYLDTFKEKSPERILKRSLNVLDPAAIERIRSYLSNSQTESGGFQDRAGKADLYYSLFGCYLADALDYADLFPALGRYTDEEIRKNKLNGINLYCSAILSSKLLGEGLYGDFLKKKIRDNLSRKQNGQTAYNAFISLLACYYQKDYQSLFLIKKQLAGLQTKDSLPSPVIAALLVLQKSFRKPVNDIKQKLLSYYCEGGGFKATYSASIPDLLSTAVVLYALNYAGHDMRLIKPDCLGFVESLYSDGGFSGNYIDTDPDIEYTFYGLLALGSLAD